jgi:hypothetical protein
MRIADDGGYRGVRCCNLRFPVVTYVPKLVGAISCKIISQGKHIGRPGPSVLRNEQPPYVEYGG